MSFYTSSSESHRSFVFWLLIPVVGLFALGVYLEPLYGDLTRIGSYAEKDFGWNNPQVKFQQPLYEIGRYERYHDVVVLGDLFSNVRPHFHWQNYLVAAKGWSVAMLNINKINLEQVLENPVFRERPPKIFIFETVERELPRRITHGKYCDYCDAIALPKQAGVTIRPSPVTIPVHVRELQGLAKLVERDGLA